MSGVAEKIMESGVLAGLSEFGLVGRIPPIEFLRRHFLSHAALMDCVELTSLYCRAEPGLDQFLEESLRGTHVEVLQGRYHILGETG